MDKLIYALLFSVFLLHKNVPFIPRQASWMTELLAVLICVVIVLRLAVNKQFFMDQKYVYLLTLYLLVMVVSTFLQDVPFQKIVAGFRVHLKHLPFFLLPAVYEFSSLQLKKQLRFILPFLLLQLPVAAFQRAYFWQRNVLTGDGVAGTLALSPNLTITLVCTFAILLALYISKYIDRRLFLIASVFMLLPTAINETKVTFILFPVALLIPVYCSERRMSWARMKNLLSYSLVGVLFFMMFVPIYNQFLNKKEGPGSLSEMVEKDGYFDDYLYKGVRGKKSEDIRRFDEIAISFEQLSKDIVTFAFGQGPGSATRSFFDSKNEDKSNLNQLIYRTSTVTSTYVFREVGLLGLMVYSAFFIIIFRDALSLSRQTDIYGVFALGWTAVVVIMAFCLIYTNYLYSNVLNILFWFFSGMIVSRVYRLRLLQRLSPGFVVVREPLVGGAVNSAVNFRMHG
jgi:hypothetical protein